MNPTFEKSARVLATAELFLAARDVLCERHRPDTTEGSRDSWTRRTGGQRAMREPHSFAVFLGDETHPGVLREIVQGRSDGRSTWPLSRWLDRQPSSELVRRAARVEPELSALYGELLAAVRELVEFIPEESGDPHLRALVLPGEPVGPPVPLRKWLEGLTQDADGTVRGRAGVVL